MIWTPANSIFRAPLFLPKRRTGKVHVPEHYKNFGWRKRKRERGGFAGYPCCDGCQNVYGPGEPPFGECSRCDSETTPRTQYEVILAGAAGVICSSGACAVMNDTFLLDQVSSCKWEYNTDDFICNNGGDAWSFSQVAAEIVATGGSVLVFRVQVYVHSDASPVVTVLEATFNKTESTLPTTFDCDYSSEDIPFDVDSGSFCTLSGGTCTVTAS